MKFTLSWLKTHLDTTASMDEIEYALTDLGLEVEEIINPMDTLADFTLGYIKSAEKHPDADRLNVCVVDTDEGEKQIICGAPNARAGITVVVAKPGTYIPGLDITIQVGKIRGIESFGMMASEREMELSEEHDGIIELPSGEVGQRFVDWLADNDPTKVDPVIDIAITPNRPDALGVRGIARDLAARGLGVLKPAPTAQVDGSFPSPITVAIDDDTRENGCEVFMGRLIKGVKNGPSPDWLQHQLKAIGLRPISALVDITNFFTYDQNRPLHVFDADKVKGNLRVHRAKGGETLIGLDEKEYTFSEGQVVISDDTGVESIAGIMGGLATGCTEETTNVFLEAAVWDTIQIAKTGRALKINSDARYRNERGIDPAFNPLAIELATQMILDLCGGETSDVVTAGEVPDVTRAYPLDTDRVQSLVGMEILAEDQRASLTALGFEVDANDMVSVPSWRPDVQGSADLVEEVARVASLTKLEGKPLPRLRDGVTQAILTPVQKREWTARRTAAQIGFNECVTYSFIDQKTAALFGGGTDATMLGNPISSEMSHMRPSILPGLLQAAARNQARGFADLAFFEVGPAFHGGEPEEQEVLITGIMVGHTGPKDRFGARRPVDTYDAKAAMEAILAAIGAPTKVQYNRDMNAWWHPGRSAKVTLGPKNVLGAFGELHPKVIKEMGVKGNVVAFAIHLANIPFPKKKSATRAALKASDLQGVDRDFAFVVDKTVEAQILVNAAVGADKNLIESVRVFDEFSGDKAEEQMGEGKKSIALAVRLQPKDKTLTDKELEAVSAQIITKVEKASGGTLRA
ncbi:MAG: phenylalanine--tRNA ligase subunit beta [Halocynthiibacter sp.]